MHIEHLKSNFEKRKRNTGLIYELGIPSSEKQIKHTEKRLSVVFYDQLKLFYRHYNGLIVRNPHLEIYPLEGLVKDHEFIYFAMINSKHKLCFDCKGLNAAGQWDIINSRDSYIVTLTFASFWSNKIWAWIDKKRAIWKPYEEALEK